MSIYNAIEERKKGTGISPKGAVSNTGSSMANRGYGSTVKNPGTYSSGDQYDSNGQKVVKITTINAPSNNSGSGNNSNGNNGYSNGSYSGGNNNGYYSNSSSSNSSNSNSGFDSSAYEAMLARYQQEAAEREAQRKAEQEARLAAQKQAAQDAYDRGMNYLNNAYNTKVNSLGSNYNSTVDQLRSNYDNSASKINKDAARSLQEAYLNNMQSQKNLNQLLSAQGLSGGATESTMAKLLANYGNARNNIEGTKAGNLSDLSNTLSNNLASALQQYNSALANADSEKMQYAMNLENALANNQIAATDSYYNALSGSDDGYLDLLKSYINNMAKYSYTPTEATNTVETVNTQQGSMANNSTYNAYLNALQQANANASNNGTQTVQNNNTVNSDQLAQMLMQLYG